MSKDALVLAFGVMGVFAMPLDAVASGKCQTSDPYPYVAPYKMDACPQDIQEWMNRANVCTHFQSEEAYDDARRAELDAAIAENKCEALLCDYGDLFAKYEGDIVYTGVLTDYAQMLYGDVEPVQCLPYDSGEGEGAAIEGESAVDPYADGGVSE